MIISSAEHTKKILKTSLFLFFFSSIHTMEISGNQNCLVTSILQNAVFCFL